MYPDVPDSLLQLLEIVDGTYWRDYAKEKVALFFLGSDMEEYPYFLLSASQMMDTKDDFQTWGDYLINREFDDILVDEGICDDLDSLCWLHFSDCVNNGGTSQLFIDFSPSAKGKKGQILRYLHAPDELVIIADSFDAYLQMLYNTFLLPLYCLWKFQCSFRKTAFLWFLCLSFPQIYLQKTSIEIT